MKSNTKIALAAIFCCLLWSSAFVGIKIGLKYTDPIRYASIRFIISGIIVMFFCSELKNYWKYVKGSWKFLVFLALLQTTFHYTMYYTGIGMVEGALAAITVGSTPLFVAITTHFMMRNDRMTWSKVLTIICGLSGVTLVAVGRSMGQENANVQILGVVMLLITNIAGSFNNILIAKEKKNIPPLVISSFSMLVGGIVMFLLSLLIEGMIDFDPRPMEYYVSFAWLIFVSAAAVSIWTVLLKKPNISVSNLNFWKFLIPVSGALLAWIFLPEEPNLISIAGIIIIGTSLIALNLHNRDANRKLDTSKD